MKLFCLAMIALVLLFGNACRSGVQAPAPQENPQVIRAVPDTSSEVHKTSEVPGQSTKLLAPKSPPLRKNIPELSKKETTILDRDRRAERSVTQKLLRQAQQYMQQAKWKQAARVLERALRIDSSDAQLWNALAQIHLQQGHYQQAENFAKKSNFLAGGNHSLKEQNELIIQNARKHQF